MHGKDAYLMGSCPLGCQWLCHLSRRAQQGVGAQEGCVAASMLAPGAQGWEPTVRSQCCWLEMHRVASQSWWCCWYSSHLLDSASASQIHQSAAIQDTLQVCGALFVASPISRTAELSVRLHIPRCTLYELTRLPNLEEATGML